MGVVIRERMGERMGFGLDAIQSKIGNHRQTLFGRQQFSLVTFTILFPVDSQR